MVSNEVADIADLSGHVSGMRHRTLVVLLDAGWTLCDFESYVGHLVHDVKEPMPLLVVSQYPLHMAKIPATWSLMLVPDVDRVAAACGVFTLPAVLVSGAMDETRRRIDAIVRWQKRFDIGRASGAISADELHQ